MLRAVLAAALVAPLAGCGGSPDPPPEEERRPAPEYRTGADLRSADARSPFVSAAAGTWRCPTAGRLVLAISAEGEASLSTPGRLLASIAPSRAVANRACDRARRAGGQRGALGAGATDGRLGRTTIRCDAPALVVVDFAGGDLVVRAPDGGFVAGAAVRADRIGVAGYWGDGCAPA